MASSNTVISDLPFLTAEVQHVYNLTVECEVVPADGVEEGYCLILN